MHINYSFLVIYEVEIERGGTKDTKFNLIIKIFKLNIIINVKILKLEGTENLEVKVFCFIIKLYIFITLLLFCLTPPSHFRFELKTWILEVFCSANWANENFFFEKVFKIKNLD